MKIGFISCLLLVFFFSSFSFGHELPYDNNVMFKDPFLAHVKRGQKLDLHHYESPEEIFESPAQVLLIGRFSKEGRFELIHFRGVEKETYPTETDMLGTFVIQALDEEGKTVRKVKEIPHAYEMFSESWKNGPTHQKIDLIIMVINVDKKVKSIDFSI